MKCYNFNLIQKYDYLTTLNKLTLGKKTLNQIQLHKSISRGNGR